MKKRIITPLLLLVLATGFSQDFSYDVRGKYIHKVSQEVLNDARLMSDIIPYYPASWITGYVSVEIKATADGNTLVASGKDDTLSADQVNMLNSAGTGTDIDINIEYLSKNSITGKLENRTMNYSASVIPETEAEFPDGYQQLKQYLKTNAIDKISGKDAEELELAVVVFTVDEKGRIADARISKTSGDESIDNLLLGAINDMPKWNPAEDSKGIKVKQEFEFSVGNAGC